jgi:surfactin synthase thioesterase subunit
VTSSARWLLKPLDDRAEARLFCFPFAGVGASALRRWPDRIGPFEVCRVQLPGRENRMGEPPYHDFDTFAGDAADALAPALDRPFALFGHCMGALLGYALWTELEHRGGPVPQRLYASSSLAPYRGFFGPFHPTMTDEYLGEQITQIARTTGAGDPLPELLPLAIALLRNDVQMCFGYRPDGPHPLTGAITTIGWDRDTDVAAERMHEWSGYAPVEHHVLAGDEFTFLRAPGALLDVIARDWSLTPAAAAAEGTAS